MTILEPRLTVEEVAEFCRVDPESVRRWIRAGKLPAAKVGTRHLVRESALAQFLDERERRHDGEMEMAA